MLTIKPKALFDKFVAIIFSFILVMMTLGIGIGSLMLVRDVWHLLRFEGITGHYIEIIADVLTLYVLVELSRSLVEYFHSKRIRLTPIIDAGIVFFLREIMIGMFKHQMKPDMVLAMAALMLALGVIRFGSEYLYQKQKQTSVTE